MVSCNFRPVGTIFETAFPKHLLPVLPTALWATLPTSTFHRTLDALWRRRVMKGRSPAGNCPAMLSDWFWRAVCKSGDRYTDILVISTILHQDSLLANLLENPGFSSLKFRAVLSEPSSPLWQTWEVDFHAPRFRFYGYCDPSMGRTAGSDYSAIITLAVAGDSGLSYVYDADLQRRHPDQIITDILDKEQQLRRETGRGYTLFGAETNQFQCFLKEQLARESARQGLYLPIQGVRATEDKTIRIESSQPDVKNGYIRFRPDQKLLLRQLEEFPLGAHDDGPDALEGARPLSRRGRAGAHISGLRV